MKTTVKVTKPAKAKSTNIPKLPVNDHLLNPEIEKTTKTVTPITVKVTSGPDRGTIAELQSFLLSTPLVKNQIHTEKVQGPIFYGILSLIGSLRDLANTHMEGFIDELGDVFKGYLKTHPNADSSKVLDQYSQLVVLLKEIERNEQELNDLDDDLIIITDAY